jgi:hypothetical protein
MFMNQQNIRGGTRQAPGGFWHAHYQTKAHLRGYSESGTNRHTLKLLWILRRLLDAANLFDRFRAGCALGERGLRLAGLLGQAA